MNKINIIKRFFCHQHLKRSELNYINNNGYNSCRDCIYITNNSKCKRFFKINNETVEMEYADTKICRTYFQLCGPNALFKITNKNGQILGP